MITSGGYYGMQTFDQALFGHVKAGRVTFEDAMRVASSPHDFKLLMQADGRQGTTMDDVAAARIARAEANPSSRRSRARIAGLRPPSVAQPARSPSGVLPAVIASVRATRLPRSGSRAPISAASRVPGVSRRRQTVPVLQLVK